MSAIDMSKEATARSAMKLARKALMDCHYYMINAGLPNQSLLNEAFTAYMELEAALALVNEVDQEQPAPATELREQEPVAWYRDEDGIRIYYESKVWDNATPLYTSPPAQRTWVGLTDDELLEVAEIDGADEWFWKVCKAVEAKLKEKNNVN